MHGPDGIADVVALVDTGADTFVVPLSIADDLGIATTPGAGPGAIAFGGQSIRLSFAEVVLELSQDQQTIRWRARMYFAEFRNASERAVVLGHEGLLDYFTAKFFGEACVLELIPNHGIPLV